MRNHLVKYSCAKAIYREEDRSDLKHSHLRNDKHDMLKYNFPLSEQI